MGDRRLNVRIICTYRHRTYSGRLSNDYSLQTVGSLMESQPSRTGPRESQEFSKFPTARYMSPVDPLLWRSLLGSGSYVHGVPGTIPRVSRSEPGFADVEGWNSSPSTWKCRGGVGSPTAITSPLVGLERDQLARGDYLHLYEGVQLHRENPEHPEVMMKYNTMLESLLA